MKDLQGRYNNEKRFKRRALSFPIHKLAIYELSKDVRILTISPKLSMREKQQAVIFQKDFAKSQER